MATDPAGVFLFGGLDAAGAATSDRWHYIARLWTPIRASGPPARAGAAMAFDLITIALLMRGGAPCTDRRTWSWSGRRVDGRRLRRPRGAERRLDGV